MTANGYVADKGSKAVEATLRSGLDAGIKEPHPDLPDQDALQVTAEKPEPPPRCSLADAHTVFKKWLGNEYDLDAARRRACGSRLRTAARRPAMAAHCRRTRRRQDRNGAGADRCRRARHQHDCQRRRPAVRNTAPRAQQEGHRRPAAQDRRPRRAGHQGRDHHPVADRNTRASVLAAIREIYDGRWERNVGTDGGATLTWVGRIVIVGAVTTAWDAAHAVVATMGDRFVLLRPKTNTGRKRAGRGAIRNTGDEVADAQGAGRRRRRRRGPHGHRQGTGLAMTRSSGC